MENESIFTLIRFIGISEFDGYLLTRTSFVGFDSESFKSDIGYTSDEEKKIEFEYQKRENLINAFAEYKSNCNPLSDVDFIETVYDISENRILYQTNANIELDIFCVKVKDRRLFGTQREESYFLNLIQKSEIKPEDILKIKLVFITENDFGKSKHNWINLFK